MDDMIFFASSKEELHQLKRNIDNYLYDNLKLKLKNNWQIFPTFVRGVDFVGYRVFENYVLLRKYICKNFKRKMSVITKKDKSDIEIDYSDWCSIHSYNGWLQHCNGRSLKRKYLNPLKKVERKYYFTHIKRR